MWTPAGLDLYLCTRVFVFVYLCQARQVLLSLRQKTMWAPARLDWWGTDGSHMFCIIIWPTSWTSYCSELLNLHSWVNSLIDWAVLFCIIIRSEPNNLKIRISKSTAVSILHLSKPENLGFLTFPCYYLTSWSLHRWTSYIYHDVSL